MRYYLMDIIKIMVILAVLLGDAAFVTALFARYTSMPTFHFLMGTHRKDVLQA